MSPCPSASRRQAEFLADNPDYAVVGSWTHNINAEGRTCEVPGLDQPTSHEAFLAALDGKPLLCHPSVMMRTETVRAAGGYRAAYRHCEDYDLWLRLSERTKLCSLPERLLRYRYSETQVSTRHVLEQHVGAAAAWFAHLERLAGRPDPTEGLDRLPKLGGFDALFGRAGVDQAIRHRVAPRIVYSSDALAGEGYDILLRHVREGGAKDGLWRTAARLLRRGRPVRALRLAAALAAA